MKLPDNFSQVCAEATRIWGTKPQEDVAFGEFGELITLIGRRAQGRDSPEQWIDEISDGIIMLNQLAIIHGADAVARLAAESDLLKRLQYMSTARREAVAIGKVAELIALTGWRAVDTDTPGLWIAKISDATIGMLALAHIYGVEAVEARIVEKVRKLTAKLNRHGAALPNDAGG